MDNLTMPLAIIEELQSHGYKLSPGTLYPILHGMECDGYLEHESRTVEGKVRKYYTIGSVAKKVGNEKRSKISAVSRKLCTASKQLVYEADLGANVSFRNPFDLSFSDHVHALVAC